MRLKDIKIGAKLNGAFWITTLFVVMVGVGGMWGEARIMNSVHVLLKERVPSIEAVHKLSEMETSVVLSERSMLLGSDKQEFAWQKERLEKYWQTIDEAWKNYGALPKGPEEEALWKQLQQSWAEWKTAHERVLALASSGNQRQAIALSKGEARTAVLKVDDVLAKLVKTNSKLLVSTGDKAESDAGSSRTTTILNMLIAAIFAQGIGYIMSLAIIKPVKQGVAFAQALQKGDMTYKIDVDQKDEIGDLATALNEMSKTVGGIIKELIGNSTTLNDAASELSDVSEQMNGNSVGMSEKSSLLASATEQMSSNLVSVSAAAEQSTANANVVATATEEMTASVTEIAQSADNARTVTSEAVASVVSASQQMNELGEAAKAISKVIEVIVEIAEQTKLLALNATIEAARAGEAGKGFAVVANEVKELAKQTNAATEEIRHKIEAMQSTADKSISEIDGINRIIHTVEEIIASIATAVEEQSITTREIAGSIGQAAAGISSVTQSVAHTVDVAKEVASDVAEVNAASGEIRAASDQLSDSALGLARMGASLTAIVEGFKV